VAWTLNGDAALVRPARRRWANPGYEQIRRAMVERVGELVRGVSVVPEETPWATFEAARSHAAAVELLDAVEIEALPGVEVFARGDAEGPDDYRARPGLVETMAGCVRDGTALRDALASAPGIAAPERR
ncbi:MAG: hypothetical protein AAFX76_08240, partial [Planctomycetota bacterium]